MLVHARTCARAHTHTFTHTYPHMVILTQVYKISIEWFQFPWLNSLEKPYQKSSRAPGRIACVPGLGVNKIPVGGKGETEVKGEKTSAWKTLQF